MGRTLGTAGVLTVLALSLLVIAPTAVGGPARGAATSVAASHALVTDAAPVPPGVASRPLPGDEMVRLTVALTPSQPGRLAALLQGLQAPTSPEYRHFLTGAEFNTQFSPAPATAGAVSAYFLQDGARRLTSTPDGLGISFDLPARAVPAALGVHLVALGPTRGAPVYTAVGVPVLPPSLQPFVVGIGGLSNVASAHYASDARALTARGPVGAGAFVYGDGGMPWYVGTDFASAYDVAQLFPPSTAAGNGTFPTGEAIATLLMSAYNQTNNTDLPAFDPAVITSYFNDTFPSGWPMPKVTGIPVSIGGVTPPSPAYFGSTNDSTDNEVENSLDLEMAGSLAPGASLYNFYFAGSIFAAPSANPSIGSVADDFATTLAAALSYNYSPNQLAVVSGSFGLPDLNDSLWDTELERAAAMGVTVLSASGDQGDAPVQLSGRFQGQWPSWPGSAAFGSYGTIAVGGLTANISGTAAGYYLGNGSLTAEYDANLTGLASQVVWYDTNAGPGNFSGTEGGASTVIPEPGWQLDSAAQPAIVNATVQQGQSYLGRSEPDVAFPAEAVIAYVARDPGGVYFQVLEGTSIAAPLFAGLIASWSAHVGHPFGYLDPELYRMASYFAAFPTDTRNPFLDVTQGSNWLFNAAPGWDAATGWGALDAVRFLIADGNSTIAGFQYTGPIPGLPPFLAINGGPPPLLFLVVVGIAVTFAVVLVLYAARAGRPKGPAYPQYPPGAYGPGSPYSGVGGLPPPAPGSGALPPPPPGFYGPPPMAMFLCPYCGAPRPAEPVRCPSCGRY